MRTLVRWALGATALLALGCSGNAPTASSPLPELAAIDAIPEQVVSTVPATLGSSVQMGDLHTSALAIYTIDVDTETLTATSRLKETRSGQANDDLYLLSIDSFLTPSSFKVSGVTGTPTTVDLEYLVTHPFPAPSNPTGTPNGSTNRADLGIAGMVLLLADVPSATGNTFFVDRVANTKLLVNADAYYAPGGLLTTSGTANTFPYRQLVDELADSRTGISNSGDVTGNFGSDGWTRSEFGASNDGWTGYGVLHQGQSSSNTLSLDKDALSAGFSLDVAIIAKYNDPRGGATPAEKKANRLPTAAADASLFAYRMPHGALDAGSITFEGQTGDFLTNVISAATLSFHVQDWDARATETTATDLSADAAFDTVAVGESGTPTMEVCIPGVLGGSSVTADVSTVVDDDSAFTGDPDVDSGRPGDALFYSALVTKGAGAGQTVGDYIGMARVTDPETGLVIGLDGNLTPLASAPAPVTYQAFVTMLLPDNDPPQATVLLTSSNPLLSGTTPSVAVTAITDPDSDPLDISVDWGNGGGFVSIVTGLTSPYANQTPTGPQMNNLDLVADSIDVVVRIDDGTAAPVDYPLSYQVGPNRAPQITGSRVLASASVMSPATFMVNAGTGTATDPEGDTISYTVSNNANGNLPTSATFPIVANSTPFVNPPTTNVAFTAYANDTLHAGIGGTAYPVMNGTVTPPIVGWARKIPGNVAAEGATAVATTGTGVIYSGNFAGTQNFGGGNRVSAGSTDIFVVKYDLLGNYLWDYVAGGTGAETAPSGLAADGSGNVWIGTSATVSLNFGGGLRTVVGTDSFLVKLNSSGIYQLDRQIGGTLVETLSRVAVDGSGNVVTGGSYTSDPVTLNGVNGSNSNGTAAWLWKLDSAGSTVWSKFFDGSLSANDQNYAVAFDPAGNVYAAFLNGNLLGNPNYGGGTRSGSLGGRVYLVRFAAAGAGAWAWDRALSNSTTDVVFGLSATATRLGVAGGFVGAADFGGGSRANAGGSDAFVALYNPATGVYMDDWVPTTSTTGNDATTGVVFDSSDNAYVSGTALTGINFGGGARTSAGLEDAFVLKLNPSLNWVADHWFGSTGSDLTADIAVDTANDVVSAGTFSGTVDFQPGATVFNMTSAGSTDPFVLKIDGPTFAW